MIDPVRLFLLRCIRIMVAPGQVTEQIVLNRTRLGGWILNFLVSAISLRWVGEIIWPEWNSIAGIMAVALIAGIPFTLVETFILHLAGRLMGSGGRWDVLVSLSGYASVPFILVAMILGSAIPISMCVFGVARFHLAFMLFFILMLIVTVIMGLILQRHGFSANYGLSARKAWLLTILGYFVIMLGESALQRSFIEKRAIPVDNIAAMTETPTPPLITSGGVTKRLAFEYTVNLRYYQKQAIRRGDIIVFSNRDGHSWIGRILGLPGEQAGLQDGRLIVKDKLLAETWPIRGHRSLPLRLVESDEYFVYPDDRSKPLAFTMQYPEIVKTNQILGPILKTDVALLNWMFPRQ